MIIFDYQTNYKDEVTRAINNLKERKPSTFLSANDKAYIPELFEGNENLDTNDEVNLAYDDSEGEEVERDLEFFFVAYLERIHVYLYDN